MRTAQADANRPLFLGTLGPEWLPAVPDVHARLTAGGRVADVGCGEGWSSIGMALAYPRTRVDGFDVDAPPSTRPRRHAASYGVGDRVRFHLVAARRAPRAPRRLRPGHRLRVHPRPARPGRRCSPRTRLDGGAGGTVLVMDERVPETFTGPGDPVEQLMYGISMLVCLPDGLSHADSVGDRHGDAAGRPCAATPATPGSPTSRCCPSSTTCSASTG